MLWVYEIETCVSLTHEPHIKSFCIVACPMEVSIEVSLSEKTFICSWCMKHVSHWHMSPTDEPHICGAHVSVKHMFHVSDAWDTISIERDWKCGFFYENFAGRIHSLYPFLPFSGHSCIIVLCANINRVSYIQFPNYIQTLLLKIWKLHW